MDNDTKPVWSTKPPLSHHSVRGALIVGGRLTAGRAEPGTPTLANTVPSGRSIAVLPFKNSSANPENEYFSDGITEEILNALAQVPGLKVSAWTSAFR